MKTKRERRKREEMMVIMSLFIAGFPMVIVTVFRGEYALGFQVERSGKKSMNKTLWERWGWWLWFSNERM